MVVGGWAGGSGPVLGVDGWEWSGVSGWAGGSGPVLGVDGWEWSSIWGGRVGVVPLCINSAVHDRKILTMTFPLSAQTRDRVSFLSYTAEFINFDHTKQGED